jgi:hypothetical protein
VASTCTRLLTARACSAACLRRRPARTRRGRAGARLGLAASTSRRPLRGSCATASMTSTSRSHAGSHNLCTLLLHTTSHSLILVEDLDQYLQDCGDGEARATRVLSFTDGAASCCGEEHVLVFTRPRARARSGGARCARRASSALRRVLLLSRHAQGWPWLVRAVRPHWGSQIRGPLELVGLTSINKAQLITSYK